MPLAGNREPWLSWRRSCFILTGVLAFTFLFNALPNKLSIPLLKDTGHSNPHLNFGNYAIDNEAIDGLTDAECASAFPDLYTDIDRAVSYWKANGHNITAQDIDISEAHAAMRILIHRNELRILESKNAVDRITAARDRAEGVINLIQRALDSAMVARELLPTVEIALNFKDDAEPSSEEGDTHSFWSFARHVSKESHQRLWLMPNFDFWYYMPSGSFGDAKREAMQHDGPFSTKIPKLVWRGNPEYGPELRNALLDTTRDKGWADVLSVNEIETWMRVDEFCKYAMTVYTEGVTYSGRLKLLMNCRSLLFVHEPQYETHYSHLLVTQGPDQNAVLVKRDWSDLEQKVKYYLSHPDEAEKIITSSLKKFRSRYTTRAATSCYVRRLIRGYAQVAFTPEVHVPMKDGEGVKLRGRPYEMFLHEPEDANFEAAGE